MKSALLPHRHFCAHVPPSSAAPLSPPGHYDVLKPRYWDDPSLDNGDETTFVPPQPPREPAPPDNICSDCRKKLLGCLLCGRCEHHAHPNQPEHPPRSQLPLCTPRTLPPDVHPFTATDALLQGSARGQCAPAGALDVRWTLRRRLGSLFQICRRAPELH